MGTSSRAAVYQGMRRLNLILVLVLLAAPAAASAKVGIELDTDPQALAPGEKTRMRVMILRETREPGGDPAPIAGRRPLVTFRNAKTGEVVRVRASRTNREGIGGATVAFPSRGEWTVDLGDIPGVLEDGTQQIRVGISASLPPETVEPPAPPAPRDEVPAAASFPMVPLLVALGLILLTAAGLRSRRERAA